MTSAVGLYTTFIQKRLQLTVQIIYMVIQQTQTVRDIQNLHQTMLTVQPCIILNSILCNYNIPDTNSTHFVGATDETVIRFKPTQCIS